MRKVKIEEIKDWWNTHSYSYGLKSDKGYIDVGLPSKDFEDLFLDYERKYKKHLAESSDEQGRVGGKFIPFDTLRNKSVLDVACGLGWSSINLALNGAKVNAIDLTPNAVNFTQRYAKYRGVDVSVTEMSAENLKFSDSTFDFVLGWGFLMHTENPNKALQELFRVLKPGGTLVLYFYYKHSISYWWNMFILRGVLLGYLVRFRGDTTKLVSRFTDGESFGGNSKTLVLTKKWFKRQMKNMENSEISFIGWGPPSLIDNFPWSRIPLGRLIPYKAKEWFSLMFGFGHICILHKRDFNLEFIRD